MFVLQQGFKQPEERLDEKVRARNRLLTIDVGKKLYIDCR